MKSFAKINIFLKIVGTRLNYHEISSRFILYTDIFDEIKFEKSNEFSIQSNVKIQNNIILKAKDALCEAGYENEINEFFKNNKIILNKNIPMGAGLGGGSSNAATFLKLVNDELNLKISNEKLCKIGSKIGADIPFFISGFKSANVSGIGEIVNEFDDDIPDIQIFTPDIFCDTPSVYKKFRSSFMQNIDLNLANKLKNLKSSDIISDFNPNELNDLLAPCIELYPKMAKFQDMFLSGSGSTLFKVKR